MHPDLVELLRFLRAHNVEFLVVGSTALAVHARPRYTEDLDLWLKRTPDNVRHLVGALREFGFDLREETLRPFWEQDRQMVTLGIKPQAVDLLNFLGQDSFEEAWERRTETLIEGTPVSVIGLADLVRSKQTAGRPKDKADLALLEEVWGNLQGL